MTVSVNWFPETVEPSPNARLKVLSSAADEELEAGLYFLWPEQVDPQLDAGRNRSELPVSKSTTILPVTRKIVIREVSAEYL